MVVNLCAEGLSPPVRGNPAVAVIHPAAAGSIPACAGEPGRGRGDTSGGGVYPRLCGGTLPGKQRRGVRGGLSPPVRGNPVAVIHPAAAAGSIPACAGEPVRLRHGGGAGGVYPRLCGGTAECVLFLFADLGLSPPVRGNR